jgi:hypothetical protein
MGKIRSSQKRISLRLLSSFERLTFLNARDNLFRLPATLIIDPGRLSPIWYSPSCTIDDTACVGYRCAFFSFIFAYSTYAAGICWNVNYECPVFYCLTRNFGKYLSSILFV